VFPLVEHQQQEAVNVMCGICGLVWFDPAKPVDACMVDRMTSTLVHRGPDAAGRWVDRNAGLGFRRLSIIDLSDRGNQPFANETGAIHLVCNGEIYNSGKLRQELIGLGHRFVSESDCETALHAYEEYGLDFVDRLDGMFAVAVFDASRQRLVLVRDRLGIKPLYYRVGNDSVRFGSELKAILADPAVPRDIDPLAVSLYLTRDVIPAPYTIYRGIEKLLPGEMLVADLAHGPAAVSRRQYWRPEFRPREGWTEARFVEALRERLREAVRSHLVSDVPVGIFISGGVDSSAVLAQMRSLSTARMQGFTIGFDDVVNDESGIARRLANDWHVDHRERRLSSGTAVELLQSLVHFFDEPFGDTSSVPTFLVSKLASEHVKVVLSGDGGDELFGGYLTSSEARNLEMAGSLPQSLRRGAAGLIGRVWPAISLQKLRLPTWLLMASLRDHLFDDSVYMMIQPEYRASRESLLSTYDRLRPQLEPLSPLNAYFAGLVAQYLQDDILTKVDRASSAHGLEVRVPLLDHHLVSLAASIPPHLRFAGGTPKYIFREAIRPDVPPSIMAHPKRGFGMPPSYHRIQSWHDALVRFRDENPLLDGIVDFSGQARWSGGLTWRVLCLGAWLSHQAQQQQMRP
jgi:asparagine synthase (glutamine-hydrolysing)